MRGFTKDQADDDNNKNKFPLEISGSRASTPSSSPLRSLSPLLLIVSQELFLFLREATFGTYQTFNHGIAQVSWSHVWAQFCLCFDGQKLLSDQDNVAIHGIKDGDQLEFARHRSISYNLAKERPEKHDRHLQESTLSTNKQEVQTRDTGNNLNENSNQQNQEDGVENENNSDDIAVNITCYCSLAHLWKRLFTPPNINRRDTNYVELA